MESLFNIRVKYSIRESLLHMPILPTSKIDCQKELVFDSLKGAVIKTWETRGLSKLTYTRKKLCRVETYCPRLHC